MKISYSFGMVDLVHFGHINAFKMAKENADLHFFGLVTDKACDAWYGVHVSDENERLSTVKSIKYIDEVLIQKDFDPLDNIKYLHKKYPQAIITLFYSSEWSVLSSKSFLETIGGHTQKIEYYEKLSPQHIFDVLSEENNRIKQTNTNIISTKANTLLALKSKLKKSVIEDIFIINVKDYYESAKDVVDKIKKMFHSDSIVIRSSSKREDAFDESNAGHFTSVIGVDSNNCIEIERAINRVIESYGDYDLIDEQVLVQRQTKNVLISGVVFTRDIQHNRPYYVINYDESGSTDSVTSGLGGKTLWISNDVEISAIGSKWKKLMEAVFELQELLPGILLDIEFAITKNDVVIFQVRPLAAAYKYGRNNNDKSIINSRYYCYQKYRKMSSEGMTVFSDMSFWNPAEIIGDNPKNLDYSLYRTIITKSAWNIGLLPLGYRKVDSELMIRFGNKPFISLEKSFEALMPSSISNDLAKKLKNYYLKKIISNPSSHDKIEFEISHNCFDFSLHDKMRDLLINGFSYDEILELESSLKKITIDCIKSYHNILEHDLFDLKNLESTRLDIKNNINLVTDYRLLAKSAKVLIEAIENFGTPQFSRHARCAFISKSICKSLVEKEYITSKIYNLFLSSIETIAVEYDKDYKNVLFGKMSQDDFLAKYGHLRSGTYNINSQRYDQVDNLFINCNNQYQLGSENNYDYNVDGVVENALSQALSDFNINTVSAKDLIWFIKESIKQREYFKFIFTKSLSLVIEIIKKMGNCVSINAENLSYLELPEIFAAEYYSSTNRLNEFWELVINKRRETYNINSCLILPSFIKDENDFFVIETMDSRANFITEKTVTGDVCILTEDSTNIDVCNKIVVIEKADPGYDWIFSKGILGLITKYGGAASHMAIRCAEFKVAAAIGCGTLLYEYAINSNSLTIDCKQEKLIRKG